MPPQRKTVMVWSRFVWVCFIPLVILKYTLDSLPHIFSSYEEILQNVLCLWKETWGWKKGMLEGKKNNRKEEGCPPPVWKDSPSPDFSVPQCPHLCFLCFRHGSIPFPAPSISHSPEGQPTEVYISKTGAGHAQTPRTACFTTPK